MTPRQQEILAAYRSGMSKRAVAKKFDINESSVRGMIKRAEAHEELDPAIREAMAAAGMADTDILHSGWIKTDTASLYFKLPKLQQLDDTVDRVRSAMETVKAAEIVAKAEDHDEDLLTIYPLFDAHIGMRATKAETGEEYDTQIAADRLAQGVAHCVMASPASKMGVILVGGDFLHHNDATNMTKSGHILDVATNIDRTIEVAIEALVTAVETAAAKHETVVVSVIAGNHDRDAYLAVLFAMMQRYRDDPRIDVQRHPGHFFIMEFGLCLFAAHHGDKAKADRLVMHLASEWPDMWGRTRFRFYFTGHLHHAKLQDVGGVQVEQLRPITSRDAYAASHAYSSRAEMQAITYHRKRGEIGRIRLAL